MERCGGVVASRTLDPRVVRSSPGLSVTRSWANTLPQIVRVFSDRTLKIVGPLCLVSVPRGSNRSHSGYIKCGIGCGRVVRARLQSAALHDTNAPYWEAEEEEDKTPVSGPPLTYAETLQVAETELRRVAARVPFTMDRKQHLPPKPETRRHDAIVFLQMQP